MDLQAMDRCHRIGQTKPVHVYRLATAQSIEASDLHITLLRFIPITKAQLLFVGRKNWNCLSCQGRILKRAFSKLKLEHVVIGKGQFKQERPKPNTADIPEVCHLSSLFQIIFYCLHHYLLTRSAHALSHLFMSSISHLLWV